MNSESILTNLMQSSAKTRQATKELILQKLKVQEADRQEKHMGLPTIVGKSKAAIFTSQGTCVEEVIGMEGEAFIRTKKGSAFEGCHTTIQAIPTYMMSISNC